MAEPLSLGSNNDNDKDNDSDNGSVEALSKKRRFDHTVPISPEIQGEDRLSKAGINLSSCASGQWSCSLGRAGGCPGRVWTLGWMQGRALRAESPSRIYT